MVLYSPDMRSLSLVLSAPEEIPGKFSEGPDSLTDANHLASKTMAYDFGELSLDTLIAPVAKATVAFTSRFQLKSDWERYQEAGRAGAVLTLFLPRVLPG